MSRKKSETKKNDTKIFIGAWIEKGVNELLIRDSNNEHRTKSGQLEHLLIVALKFRGYDVNHLVEDAEHNGDLQRMSKLVRKEITPEV